MKIYWDTILKQWTKPEKNQFPTGSRVYKGFQGSGKTLSMVDYAIRLQKEYPKCKIFSNIKIKGLNNYNYIEDENGLIAALQCRNSGDGVLILLDEAHLFFNKKKGISLDVLTAISQQRKDRKRMVFSSQIWEELDISLRKQVKEIVNCRCLFGLLQFNTLSDGETLAWNKQDGEYQAKKIGSELFKHTNELYNAYDTYQKIINNNDYSREFNKNVVNYTAIKS